MPLAGVLKPSYMIIRDHQQDSILLVIRGTHSLKVERCCKDLLGIACAGALHGPSLYPCPILPTSQFISYKCTAAGHVHKPHRSQQAAPHRKQCWCGAGLQSLRHACGRTVAAARGSRASAASSAEQPWPQGQNCGPLPRWWHRGYADDDVRLLWEIPYPQICLQAPISKHSPLVIWCICRMVVEEIGAELKGTSQGFCRAQVERCGS